MRRHWFYLSCAEADWEPFLEKFHNDLSNSLSQRTGLAKEDLGYFGINRIQAAGEDSQSAIDALNHSHLLLQLLTPAYFLSDACAREWQIFRWRERALMRTLTAGTRHPSSIIPVFWDAERTLPPPPAAMRHHLKSERHDFGDQYTRQGLRQLMADSTNLNVYHDFVVALSDRLYHIATSYELPSIENLPAVWDIPDVFTHSKPKAPTAKAAPAKVRASEPLSQSVVGYQEATAGPAVATPKGKERIFISYRRHDTEGFAGRLFDQLANHFGEDQIFMDLDAIEPGEDFIEVIEEAVGDCHLMIAIIGRGWVTCTDGQGRRRLDNPEDFVRVEISAALERGIRVIPVLVQGASIPRADQLPEALAKLARRNAFELSSMRWKYDVGRLVATIEKILRQAE